MVFMTHIYTLLEQFLMELAIGRQWVFKIFAKILEIAFSWKELHFFTCLVYCFAEVISSQTYFIKYSNKLKMTEISLSSVLISV